MSFQNFPVPVPADVAAAFKKYDADNSQTIDVSELAHALADLGVGANTLEEASAVLHRYTSGTSSELSLDQFASLVTDIRKFMSSTVSPEIEAAFHQFDTDRSGSIDASELRSALAVLGINAASTKESGAILSQYDASCTRELSLTEFARLVRDIQQFNTGQQQAPAQPPPAPVARVPSAQEVSAQGISQEVREAFVHFDADGSGHIDARELQAALVRLGLPATASETVAVMRQYDASQTKGLDLNEFNRLVLDARKFKGESDRASTMETQIRRAFEQFDTDRSGDLSALELRRALEKLGLSTTMQQSNAILKQYDSGGTKRLTLDEFTRLARDVLKFEEAEQGVPPNVRTAFEMFDKDRSGDIDAAELRAALQSLGVPMETLTEAASLLNIYDANRSARLSLFEFSQLCTEVLQHNFGSSEAMGPLLRQREISLLFSQHEKAIDELFSVYAPTQDAEHALRHAEVVRMCDDFKLLRGTILSLDDVTPLSPVPRPPRRQRVPRWRRERCLTPFASRGRYPLLAHESAAGARTFKRRVRASRFHGACSRAPRRASSPGRHASPNLAHRAASSPVRDRSPRA